MKNVLLLTALLVVLSAAATTPPEVNEKVIKAFNETFSEAENVKWQERANLFQADFKISEIAVRAIYADDGSLLQTVRYYTEKNLPSNILAKVKTRYENKQVFGVTEIVNDNEVSFHIVLKDEKHWYWIKSDPYGNMEQTQKLKRGEPTEKTAF